MAMKCIEYILLTVALWTTAVLGKSNLYTGWTQKYFDNTPYQNQTAEVGDTITFIWTDDEVQNVFIHPTNDCDQTGRIPVGNQSPTTYTFTEEDSSPDGNEIFFACDIDDRCEEHGMRLTVTVFPSSRDLELEPTSAPVISPVVVTEAPFVIVMTDAPSVAPVIPTIPPVAPVEPTIPPVSPTEVPTEVPSEAPFIPTSPPVDPTEAPVSPTDPPVAPVSPTDPPVAPVSPTDPPVAPVSPTDPPVDPTEAPVPPTASPVDPTDAPVPEPTMPPTDAPVAPVSYPTISPTPDPTKEPTLQRTIEPTVFPAATSVPTKLGQPVSSLTEAPTSFEKKIMRGLQMTIDGITSFGEDTQDAWGKTTETFSTSHYENDFPSTTFTTTITVTNYQEISRRSRWLIRGLRKLQTQTTGFVITYNQEVLFDNNDNDITDSYLAKSAFETPDQRDQYVQSLKNSGNPVLETATDVTKPTFAGDTVPTDSPLPIISPTPVPTEVKKEPILSMAAIIGIACGGGALLIIIILFCIYCSKKRSKDKQNIDSTPPPLSVSLKEDEVSTLAGPSITGGGAQGDRSVGTVDYDYSKAYGNGDTSVSSAGGTFGSNTQNISLPANAAATGAALGPYDDDGSYEAHFRNPGNNVKEEILHIFAPPGKLGVVIDTPDDGAPVVHAVKDSSVVVDKVQVGDKLVAVDDEDVRTLTAIKVSKLISRKSANPSRKLTILRTTLIE